MDGRRAGPSDPRREPSYSLHVVQVKAEPIDDYHDPLAKAQDRITQLTTDLAASEKRADQAVAALPATRTKSEGELRELNQKYIDALATASERGNRAKEAIDEKEALEMEKFDLTKANDELTMRLDESEKQKANLQKSLSDAGLEKRSLQFCFDNASASLQDANRRLIEYDNIRIVLEQRLLHVQQLQQQQMYPVVRVEEANKENENSTQLEKLKKNNKELEDKVELLKKRISDYEKGDNDEVQQLREKVKKYRNRSERRLKDLEKEEELREKMQKEQEKLLEGLKEADNSVEKVKKERDELRAALILARAEMEEAKNAVRDTNIFPSRTLIVLQKNAENQEKIERLEAKVRELEGKILNQLQLKLDYAMVKGAKERLEKDLVAKEEENAVRMREMEEEKRRMECNRDEIQNRLEEVEKKMMEMDNKSQMSKLVKELDDQKAKDEMTRMKTEVEDEKRKIDREKEKIKNRMEELERTKTEFEQKMLEFERKEQESAETQLKIVALEAEIAELKGKIGNQLQAKLDNAMRKSSKDKKEEESRRTRAEMEEERRRIDEERTEIGRQLEEVDRMRSEAEQRSLQLDWREHRCGETEQAMARIITVNQELANRMAVTEQQLRQERGDAAVERMQWGIAKRDLETRVEQTEQRLRQANLDLDRLKYLEEKFDEKVAEKDQRLQDALADVAKEKERIAQVDAEMVELRGVHAFLVSTSIGKLNEELRKSREREEELSRKLRENATSVSVKSEEKEVEDEVLKRKKPRVEKKEPVEEVDENGGLEEGELVDDETSSTHSSSSSEATPLPAFLREFMAKKEYNQV